MYLERLTKNTRTGVFSGNVGIGTHHATHVNLTMTNTERPAKGYELTLTNTEALFILDMLQRWKIEHKLPKPETVKA